MAYQLESRDSQYWLYKAKESANVGPGVYEGANTTNNTWNLTSAGK